MACSTCHVIVDKAWYDKLPGSTEDEEDMLDLAFGLTHTSRLGCQIKMTQNLSCDWESTLTVENTIFVCGTDELQIEHCETDGDPDGTYYGLSEYEDLCASGALTECATFTNIHQVETLDGILAGGDWEAGDDFWDWRLASGTSIAVDAGTTSGTSVDFDGESRPAGSGYDIGADEWTDP